MRALFLFAVAVMLKGKALQAVRLLRRENPGKNGGLF